MIHAISRSTNVSGFLIGFSFAFALCWAHSPQSANGLTIQAGGFNSAEIAHKAFKIELPASLVERHNYIKSRVDATKPKPDAAPQPDTPQPDTPQPDTPHPANAPERTFANSNPSNAEKPERFSEPFLKPETKKLNKDGANFDPAKLNAKNSSAYFGRESLAIKSAIRPIAKKLSPCVVEIFNEYGHVTLGTVVSSDGLVIAKHSELSKTFQCRCSNGVRYKGRLIGIHPQNDLALIQIKASNLTPIEFSKFAPARPGSLVVSVGADDTSIGFGLVSVQPQTFAIQQPECKDCIDLGATVGQFPIVRQSNPTIENNSWQLSGLEVQRVYPRTASESTGLLVGDLMQTINGISLTSRSHMDEIGKTLKIGQTLKIGVLRSGKSVQLSTEIKNFAPRTLHDRWGGGPFSTRRFGFGKVIAHDSVIAPENCGGPLVALDGNVVGINIARSMRVATFAVPISSIYRFIKYVRPNSKLNEMPDRG